jgi:DNA-binding IclR family transcriptional regulator
MSNLSAAQYDKASGEYGSSDLRQDDVPDLVNALRDDADTFAPPQPAKRRSPQRSELDAGAGSITPAITRAAAILSVLASQPQRAFGPSELSRKTGIPKSSVHNLCIAMSQVGFLRRDNRGVRLHHRLAELGNAYLGGQREIEEFYDLCHRRIGGAHQTVQLGVLADGLTVIFLARHDGHEPLNLGRASEIGRSVPAHCTANGKALLAALGTDELKTLLPRSGRLPTITPRSISDAATLSDELAAIRRRGYSAEQGEIVRGLHCFGVAVRTPHRKDGLIGISFSYPEQPSATVPATAGADLRRFAERFAERIKGELAF